MEQIFFTTLLGSGDTSKHFATTFYPLNSGAGGDDYVPEAIQYSWYNKIDVDTDGTIYASSSFGLGRSGVDRPWARGGLYKFTADGRYLTTLDQWPTDMSTKTSYALGPFAVHEGKIHYGPVQSRRAGSLSSYDASTGSAIPSSYKYSTTNYTSYTEIGPNSFFVDKTNSIYYNVLTYNTGDYIISKAYLDPASTTLIRFGYRTSMFGAGSVVADSNGNMFLGGGTGGGGYIYAFNSSWTPIWGFIYLGSYDGGSTDRSGIYFLHYMPETNTILYGSHGSDAAGTGFLKGTGVINATDGTPVWTGSHSYYAMAGTSDEFGNTYIVYRQSAGTSPATSSYIVKVDPTGTVLWTNTVSAGVTSIKYVDGDLLIYGYYIYDYAVDNPYKKYLSLLRVPSDGSKTGSFFGGKLVYSSTTNWEYGAWYSTAVTAGITLSTNTTGDALTVGTPGAFAPQSSMYTDYRAL